MIPTPNSDTEEFLGNDVALSDNYVLAGAPFRNKGTALSGKDLGAAFLYDGTNGNFLQEIDDTAPVSGDRFGWAVALDGGNAAIAATTDRVGTINPGQVFTYATTAPVPEPDTWMFLAGGLAGLALLRRRGGAASILGDSRPRPLRAGRAAV